MGTNGNLEVGGKRRRPWGTCTRRERASAPAATTGPGRLDGNSGTIWGQHRAAPNRECLLPAAAILDRAADDGGHRRLDIAVERGDGMSSLGLTSGTNCTVDAVNKTVTSTATAPT